MFRDTQHAWNPTQEEIKIWAYSNELAPEQDWELAVNSFENIPMICGFIADEKCKHIPFFLGCLYVFTGDIVRSEDADDLIRLITLLDQVDTSSKSEELKIWIDRSKHLIQHPEDYVYDYWGLGSKYVYF